MATNLDEELEKFKQLKLRPRPPRSATQLNAPGPRESAKKAAPAAEGEEAATNGEADELAQLIETFKRQRGRLLSLPEVKAVDIGYWFDEETGQFRDQLAIRVHVDGNLDEHRSGDGGKREKEVSSRELRYSLLVSGLKASKEIGAPAGENAEPLRATTNVIRASYGPHQRQFQVVTRPVGNHELSDSKKSQLRRSRLNPLAGGISIGGQSCPSGTLGAMVWDRRDGSLCLLGNWHVLAGRIQAEVGSPCFQPGMFDQGLAADIVARLKRWSLDRSCDAAIAELSGSRRYCSGEILGFPSPIVDAVDPYLGMVVFKSGRSTGLTFGFVDGILFTSAIEYGNGVTQLFEGQIHIAPLDGQDLLCDPGDSGSIWATLVQDDPDQPDDQPKIASDKKGIMAVGLHFAGNLPHSAFGEFALANPMTAVMEELEFSFRPLFLDENEPTGNQALQLSGSGSLPAGANPAPTGMASGLKGAGSQPFPEVKDTGGKPG